MRMVVAAMLVLAVPQEGMCFFYGEKLANGYVERVAREGLENCWEMTEVVDDLVAHFRECEDVVAESKRLFGEFMAEFQRVHGEAGDVLGVAKENVPRVDWLSYASEENYREALDGMEEGQCGIWWKKSSNKKIFLAVLFALLCATAVILAIYAPLSAPVVSGVFVRAIALVVNV